MKLISPYVFAKRIVHFLLYSRFYLSSVSHCIDWFMSDLVGNPEDRFSRIAAHLCLVKKETCTPSAHEFRPSTKTMDPNFGEVGTEN